MHLEGSGPWIINLVAQQDAQDGVGDGKIGGCRKKKVSQCRDGGSEASAGAVANVVENCAEIPDDQITTLPTETKTAAVVSSISDISLSSILDFFESDDKKPSAPAPLPKHDLSTPSHISYPDHPALKETPRKTYSRNGVCIHLPVKRIKGNCACLDSCFCGCCGDPAEPGFCFCHSPSACVCCGEEFKTEEELCGCEDSNMCGDCGQWIDVASGSCGCPRVGQVCVYCEEEFKCENQDLLCGCYDWKMCDLCGQDYEGEFCCCQEEEVCELCGDPKSRCFREKVVCEVCGEVFEGEACWCEEQVCEVFGKEVEDEGCGYQDPEVCKDCGEGILHDHGL